MNLKHTANHHDTAKNHENAHFFHDLAISFCGSSNVGKTTLITKLTKNISLKHRVGYLKHDAHHFTMDHAGKDTHRVKEAGAQMISISSQEKSAFIGEHLDDCSDNLSLNMSESVAKLLMADCDVVFVEGYKYSSLPKILMVETTDDQDFFFRQWKNGDLTHVLAIVSANEREKSSEKEVKNGHFSGNIPVFCRDDEQNIAQFILDHWQRIVEKREIYGLVLCGGKSLRMGEDKAALHYFGVPQARYVHEMLGKSCKKVFISCRAEQKNDDYLKNLPQIRDKFHDFGPMGGILSAMHTFPLAAWMVVACDLPYLEQNTLDLLLKKRDPFKLATCFYNKKKNWAEPLCSIYEPKALIKLAYNLALGRFCPRKILSQSNIALIQSDFASETLKNVNNPQEKKSFFEHFEKK